MVFSSHVFANKLIVYNMYTTECYDMFITYYEIHYTDVQFAFVIIDIVFWLYSLDLDALILCTDI